jgi:hypothetical protein
MTTKARRTSPNAKPSRDWVCPHCRALNIAATCGCAADRAARGIKPVDFKALGFAEVQF